MPLSSAPRAEHLWHRQTSVSSLLPDDRSISSRSCAPTRRHEDIAVCLQGDPFDFPADDASDGNEEGARAHESSDEDLPRAKGTKPAAVSRKTRPVAEQQQQQQQQQSRPEGGTQGKVHKVYKRSKPAKALDPHAEDEAAPATQTAAKRGKAATDDELSAEGPAQAKQERQKTGQRPAAVKKAAHGGKGDSPAEGDALSSGGSGEDDDDESDDSSSEEEYQPTQKGKRQRAADGRQVCAPPMLPLWLLDFFS